MTQRRKSARPHLYRLSKFNSGSRSLTSGPAPHRYRPSALPRLCPTLSLQRKITSGTALAAQQHSASIGGLRLSAECASSPARLTLQCRSQPWCAAPPIPHQIPPAVLAFVRPSSFLRSWLAPPTSPFAPAHDRAAVREYAQPRPFLRSCLTPPVRACVGSRLFPGWCTSWPAQQCDSIRRPDAASPEQSAPASSW